MTAAIIIFVLTLALTGAGIFLLLRAQSREQYEALQLRLRMMGGDEAAAALSFRSRDERLGTGIVRWLCHLLWRTGAEIEPETVRKILLISVLLVPVAMFLFGIIGGLLLLAVIAAFGWGVLTRRASARRSKIIEQLPPFLESVMRVLSAGNTLEESIASSSREAPEPLRPLMVSVGRQVRLGAPVEQVLMEIGDIHQLRDLKVMALAAAINRKFGGSLRNILRSLIQSIRARDVANRELRALTAETRFSAMVLAIIPVSITLFIYIRNPQYYTNMWADTAGRMILVVSILMQVMGVIVMMRMMRSTEDPA